MKKCSICKEEKDLSEFYNNPAKKDGLSDRCIPCWKIYKRSHYLANKQEYIRNAKKNTKKRREEFSEFRKNLKCEQCGESRWWVLDFHHIDPSEKEFSISTVIGRMSKGRQTILDEIAKCKILCSNCHRDFHYKEKQAVIV